MAGVSMASISSSGLMPDHEHLREDRDDRPVLSLAGASAADSVEPDVAQSASDDRVDLEEAVTSVSRRPSDRPSDKRVEWVRAAVARYERPLTQYASHLLGGDVDRARDLVQEAFLRL